MIYLVIAFAVAFISLAYLHLRLLKQAAKSEEENRKERQELMQRIQAPQLAVQQHYAETMPPIAEKAYVSQDDDEEWDKYAEEQWHKQEARLNEYEKNGALFEEIS